jgi:hypothetical protein
MDEATVLGTARRTQVVGGHDDAIFELQGYY